MNNQAVRPKRRIERRKKITIGGRELKFSIGAVIMIGILAILAAFSLAQTVRYNLEPNERLTADCQGSGFDIERISRTEIKLTCKEAKTNPPATPPAEDPPVADICDPVPENVVQNAAFDEGQAQWKFHTNGAGDFTIDSAGYCGNAARVEISRAGQNVQLFQTGVQLEANTAYRLSFIAKSNNGRDLSVYLHKHQPDYRNYGLRDFQFDLSPEWQSYQVEFTTSGFPRRVRDSRLRFWLAPFSDAGDVYWIDQVVLVKADQAPPLPPIDPPPVDPPPTELPPTETPPEDEPIAQCNPIPHNVVQNFDFSAGDAQWKMHTNGTAVFSVEDEAVCGPAATITIDQPGSNVQFYQPGLTLQANTTYLLSFWGKSNNGRNLSLFLHKHDPNYANYGLRDHEVDLSPDWQQFQIEFTTSGFSGEVNDARLRFWLAPHAKAGDVYWIDQVSLVPAGDAPPITPLPPVTETAVPVTETAVPPTESPAPENTPDLPPPTETPEPPPAETPAPPPTETPSGYPAPPTQPPEGYPSP